MKQVLLKLQIEKMKCSNKGMQTLLDRYEKNTMVDKKYESICVILLK